MDCFTIQMDIITGTWREGKRYAFWETDDGIVKGFGYVAANGKGKMYVDANKNGRLDLKKDKLIGKSRIVESAYDSQTTFGTWTVDPSTRRGLFLDAEGIEMSIVRINDTSFF